MSGHCTSGLSGRPRVLHRIGHRHGPNTHTLLSQVRLPGQSAFPLHAPSNSQLNQVTRLRRQTMGVDEARSANTVSTTSRRSRRASASIPQPSTAMHAPHGLTQVKSPPQGCCAYLHRGHRRQSANARHSSALVAHSGSIQPSIHSHSPVGNPLHIAARRHFTPSGLYVANIDAVAVFIGNTGRSTIPVA